MDFSVTSTLDFTAVQHYHARVYRCVVRGRDNVTHYANWTLKVLRKEKPTSMFSFIIPPSAN